MDLLLIHSANLFVYNCIICKTIIANLYLGVLICIQKLMGAENYGYTHL